MRVIGEVPHPKYKITVFSMNERLSVKIEDKLLEQIYKFRDGTAINNTTDVADLLDDAFMQKVAVTFQQMGETYFQALEAKSADEDLQFKII